jgi:hypothetical protein
MKGRALISIIGGYNPNSTTILNPEDKRELKELCNSKS